MQTERRVAANPQTTKPTNLGCESAERLAATIRRRRRKYKQVRENLYRAPKNSHVNGDCTVGMSGECQLTYLLIKAAM